MRIDVEEFQIHHNWFQHLNSVPIEAVEVYENGVRIPIPPEVLRGWRYCGLSNWSFMEMETYRTIPDDWKFEEWKGYDDNGIPFKTDPPGRPGGV